MINFNGSSPRVRGTLLLLRLLLLRLRFIPAGAGNTLRSQCRCCRRTVHPRGCGEHGVTEMSPVIPDGSSPRVRGTRIRPAAGGEPHRFIPAGAGNTQLQFYCPFSLAVHPRGCGEHAARNLDRGHHVGSSPRVRGTLGRWLCILIVLRFIPAGAGNTSRAPCLETSGPVHPRGCGEHASHTPYTSSRNGSSPRVRGTPSFTIDSGTFSRFIPAGAGNTVFCSGIGSSFAVHPRGCGEHPSAARSSRYSAGSSPRVRGTRTDPIMGQHLKRFIPAGAGNTLSRLHPPLT